MSAQTTETITYFERPGKQNTDALLAAALERAKNRKITHVVLPSSSGATALKAVEVFKETGIKLVVVTLHCGFSKEGLPIGLQVLAKHFDEEKLLQVAYNLEQAISFRETRPSL